VRGTTSSGWNAAPTWRADCEERLAMNTMNYLFAAYTAIWIILAVYMYSIHSREKRLRQDVERLKQLLEPRISPNNP
jgi:CcmD family protein